MDDKSKKATQEVAIATSEAQKISDKVYKLKIRKDSDLEEASDELKNIKKMIKAVDDKRRSFTDPLNNVIKDINAEFKNPLDRLKDAEKLIKDAMLKYHAQVEARAAKRADKIEDAVDAGEMEVGDAMGKLSNIKQAKTSVGSTSIKTVTKIRISDASQLPPGYFLRFDVLDALRKEVERDVKAGAPLPSGAEYYQDKQVAVRA